MANMDAQAMLQEMFQLKDQFASTRRDLAAAAALAPARTAPQDPPPLRIAKAKPEVHKALAPAQSNYNAAMDPENPFLQRKVQALQIAVGVRAAFLQRTTMQRLRRGLLWARIEKVPRPNTAPARRPPTAVTRINGVDKNHPRPDSHRRLTARYDHPPLSPQGCRIGRWVVLGLRCLSIVV